MHYNMSEYQTLFGQKIDIIVIGEIVSFEGWGTNLEVDPNLEGVV